MEASTTSNEVLELPERAHKEGCPGIEDDSRLEWFEVKFTTGPHAGKKGEVIRCPDCGGQIERPKED